MIKKAIVYFPIKVSGSIACAYIHPESSDWWTSVRREGVDYDIHYCEEWNQISVYRVGPDKWREELVHAQPIDPAKRYDPMVKPTDVYAELQNEWLDAEGQVCKAREDVREANEKLEKAYAKAHYAYGIFTKFKQAQHENQG